MLLRQWVTNQFPGQDYQIEPASADASFRRYFRITLPDGTTRIVMDAPPEHEDCRPFLKVAALFHETGVQVPLVHAEDLEQGFLLLSDLGNTTYLSALNETTAPKLYRDANIALVAIQRASRPGVLPEYDRALLERELQLFPDWYVSRHLGVTLDETQQATLRSVFDKILDNNLAQPQVFVHRDYHSRNLMLLPGERNPGILDFQDAVHGPITYDLVSLLRDAYVKWEEDQVLDWAIRYWERARAAGLPMPAEFGDFYRDFEWMGLQRHLKVLGIFARLYHRDGKDRYLADVPLVLGYVRDVVRRYGALRPLAALIDRVEGDGAPAVGYTF
jgi:aminoglycoside/choline kinase family phosphotransferase